MTQGWIGVDLDGTLAFWDDSFRGADNIGPPLPLMLERVKAWVADGKDVRIFTARVGPNRGRDPEYETRAREAITAWYVEHVGRALPITATKDFSMIELWDDRAVQVIPNTGRTLSDATLAEITALEGK